MTCLALFSIAALIASSAAAQEQPVPPAANHGHFDLADEKEKEKVLDCAGEKFVFAWGAGAHPTKVTLCGEKGATTDQLVRMIGDAADKIEATTGIPEDRRKALVHQMHSKIDELQAREAKPK
jgi:hypothetical protein